MRVLGIDVAKNSVTCCLLDSLKFTDCREAYRESQLFYKFDATSEGFEKIGDLGPQYAIMEPTGNNYSRLWKRRLEESGVTVFLVGHGELSNYRKALGLPDKDDEADALALAKYGIDYIQNESRFLTAKTAEISLLKERILDLEHYARIRNALINRLKQQLAWQFPEVASYRVGRIFLGQPPLLWRWLAGLSNSERYDRLYKNSCGEGLKPIVRQTAKILCEIYFLENSIENQIKEILENPAFSDYLKVFKEFEFGEKLQALLLAEVYPIEKFFGGKNRPDIVRSIGKKSGKITKKNLSQRRFKKFLGCAPIRNWSGDSLKNHKKHGSSLVRCKMYLWILCKIAKKKSRPETEVGRKLGRKFDEFKNLKIPTRKAWAKVRSKAIEELYSLLVKTCL